jgi:hypothetical protein
LYEKDLFIRMLMQLWATSWWHVKPEKGNIGISILISLEEIAISLVWELTPMKDGIIHLRLLSKLASIESDKLLGSLSGPVRIRQTKSKHPA